MYGRAAHARYEEQLRYVMNKYGIEGAEGEGAIDDIANRLIEFARRISEARR